jgi:hypothetical protein
MCLAAQRLLGSSKWGLRLVCLPWDYELNVTVQASEASPYQGYTAKAAGSLAEMGRVETLEGGEKDGFRCRSSCGSSPEPPLSKAL